MEMKSRTWLLRFVSDEPKQTLFGLSSETLQIAQFSGLSGRHPLFNINVDDLGGRLKLRNRADTQFIVKCFDLALAEAWHS